VVEPPRWRRSREQPLRFLDSQPGGFTIVELAQALVRNWLNAKRVGDVLSGVPSAKQVAREEADRRVAELGLETLGYEMCLLMAALSNGSVRPSATQALDMVFGLRVPHEDDAATWHVCLPQVLAEGRQPLLAVPGTRLPCSRITR
jgi:hypothetical protein